MAKHPARYAITYGLDGCYMPDSHAGAFEVHTRRDLAALIKAELETYDLPASLFSDVKIRRLWSFIARNGSSSAHFTLRHKGNALCFSGLTEQEYAYATREDA